MRIIFIFLLAMLPAIHSFAGKIVGKVTDEKTGEGVIGAAVIIKETGMGTATDVDGNFDLEANPGTYVLQVKYIGYQTKEIENVVVGSGNTTINIVLSESKSTELGEMVVRSSLKKENINALYALQKSAISVSSGISADLIQRSPDRNTGEVLKRVSGASIQNGKFVVIRGLSERYNAAMINGAQMQSTEPDKKAFSYDVIPSNLIDNITISKTASAELPGDFAGGVVQIVTKDVPDNNFVNVGVSAGYNSQTTFNEFISNGRSGSNYLGFSNEPLPSSFGSSYQEYKGQTLENRQNAARALGNKYMEQKSTTLPNSNVQVSLGNARTLKNGAKLGTIIGLVHRNGYTIVPAYERGNWDNDGEVNSYGTEKSFRFNSAMASLANFAYVTSRTKVSFRNLFNSIHDNSYYQRQGFSMSSLQQYNLYSSVPLNRQLYNTQLDGDHALGNKNIKLFWNLNYSSLRAKQEDIRTAYYARSGSLDQSNEFEVDEAEPFKIVDRNSRRFFSNLNDKAYGGSAYLNIPYTLFDQKQIIKFGYSGMLKNRDFSARVFQYQPSFTFDESIATLPVDEVFANENISNNGFELAEISNPTDRYNAKSFLNACYLLFDNHLSEQVRLSFGARFESYSQNIKAIDFSGTQIDKTDVFSDILPSLNLSYDMNDENKFRLSASRTVNRPEFREIAPFMFVDYENNWQITGNPNLVRANITNVDLRYEYYPGPGEAITVGTFYKHFQNPIENKMDAQSNLDLLIFGFNNAKSARAFGAEIDVRKNLSFISDKKWLDNLIVGANFTYVNSKVQVDSAVFGFTKDRPLQGQSPYLINLSLLYNDAATGLGFSALYNRVGERIYIVGTSSIPTTWEKARNVIDLQVSKSLLKNKAELKFTISDILNQPYLFYWNYDKKDTYKEGTDRVFQKYALGTTYTLGFTYKFGK